MKLKFKTKQNSKNQSLENELFENKLLENKNFLNSQNYILGKIML